MATKNADDKSNEKADADLVEVVARTGFDGPEGVVEKGQRLAVPAERADYLTDVLNLTTRA